MLLIPLKMKIKNGVNLCVLADRLRSLVKNACACGGFREFRGTAVVHIMQSDFKMVYVALWRKFP